MNQNSFWFGEHNQLLSYFPSSNGSILTQCQIIDTDEPRTAGIAKKGILQLAGSQKEDAVNLGSTLTTRGNLFLSR